jgi:hypothetical protein
MHRKLTAALVVTFVSLSMGLLSAQAASLVVQLAGTAVGEMRQIDTNGDGTPDKEANCFDVDLVDPNSGEKLGTGSDCLSDLEVLNPGDPGCENPDESIGGCDVRLLDTTIFNFSDGTLVSQGAVSIPVANDEDTLDAGITHVTGSFPTENNILYGTGRFENVQGKVRVSGGVNMSTTVKTNEITFDCFFHLQLEE